MSNEFPIVYKIEVNDITPDFEPIATYEYTGSDESEDAVWKKIDSNIGSSMIFPGGGERTAKPRPYKEKEVVEIILRGHRLGTAPKRTYIVVDKTRGKYTLFYDRSRE